MTTFRQDYNNAAFDTNYQNDLNGLNTRKLVTDYAANYSSETNQNPNSENDFTCSEKCQICCAEGCGGCFPCMAKKKIHFIYEYQRYIVMRFGRNVKALGPGLVELLNEPNIDKIYGVIDIREAVFSIPTQTVTTRDEIVIQIEGICFFEVFDPAKSVLNITGGDVDSFTRKMARDTLKNAVESHTFLELMQEKQQLQLSMKEDIQRSMLRYGVRVTRIEIKNMRIVADQFYDSGKTVVDQPSMLRK